jgi:hypothetical protein
MYECVSIDVAREEDSVLEAEGPLDDESDCSESDVGELIVRRGSESRSVTSSMGTEAGSPMVIDDL